MRPDVSPNGSAVKHAELRSIVHNVADSLASGIGLLIGHYEMDVFGEASRSPGGSLTVDFVRGRISEGIGSSSLAESVALYANALAKLCEEAGGSITELHEAKARYWSDPLRRRFSVTIEDDRGRRSTTDYAGVPGQRIRIMDSLGRLRPKPSINT